MLHILLLILKIIGIILAVIIGLFIIVLAIVLFTPVRYQGRGKYENTLDSLEGVVKVTWLLRLVSGSVSYRNKQLVWNIRVAWKRFPIPEEKLKPAKSVKQENSATPAKKDILQKNSQLPEAEKTQAEATVHRTDEAMRQGKKVPIKKAKATEKRRRKTKTNKLHVWYEKVKHLILNIKYTIVKIYDNIKMLLKKKDDLVAFVFLDVHKAAWAKGKKEIVRFLSFLKPNKFEVRGTFGFEDPCLTGQVLAGLSMLYPFIGNNAFITPDFEQSILDGSVVIKGNLRCIYILTIGIRLLLDKNVRKTIKNIRHYKF